MESKIHWYEICFYGDEDEVPEDPVKACSYVVKTEIEDVLAGEKMAPEILLRGFQNQREAQELREHLTAVFGCTEEEAQFFDVEDLTVKVTDELGTYYIREVTP